MTQRSFSSTAAAVICTCAALVSLVGMGCGMRTEMGTADDEDGQNVDEGGAGAGGTVAKGGSSGAKPVSSQAGAAGAGAGSSTGPQAGGGMSAPGNSNRAGSPVGGFGAAAGSAGSRGGAGGLMGGNSGSPSSFTAGRKAESSSSGAGGSAGGGGKPNGGSKSSSGSSGPRDAGVRDSRLPTDTNATVPPTINPNSGYATFPAGTVVLNGYVSSYVGGSGSSITLDFTETSFCASGKVGASSTYNSWAGAGLNVNQTQSGSGSTRSLKIEGTTITVSYENKKDSRLELQLWDGSSYWCTYLPSAKGPTTHTVPLSSLNTRCWDGSGTAFTSGTSITTVQLVVPGSATTPTPFDYCFLGITIL